MDMRRENWKAEKKVEKKVEKVSGTEELVQNRTNLVGQM